jgi:hypothetical protein
MGTTVTEVPMEPENRPYVDADTEPGDSGTEEWADSPKGSEDPSRRGSLADPEGPTDDDGAIEGSPADAFINDPEAIGARDGEDDRP